MAIPGLNKDVLDRIIKELGLQSAVEKLPVELVSTIQPVLIANPQRCIDVVKTSNVSGTLYTVPSEKTEFYLTNVNINCTSTNSVGTYNNTISVTLESGETVDILGCGAGSGSTNSSSSNTSIQSFKIPIKLLKGSSITSTKHANISLANFGIMGYTVDIL